jgi:hypothetical protein
MLTTHSRKSLSLSDWRWINAELEKGAGQKSDEDDGVCSAVSGRELDGF